jgi:hypothetical protein
MHRLRATDDIKQPKSNKPKISDHIKCAIFGHQWVGSNEKRIYYICQRCGKKIKWYK